MDQRAGEDKVVEITDAEQKEDEMTYKRPLGQHHTLIFTLGVFERRC